MTGSNFNKRRSSKEAMIKHITENPESTISSIAKAGKVSRQTAMSFVNSLADAGLVRVDRVNPKRTKVTLIIIDDVPDYPEPVSNPPSEEEGEEFAEEAAVPPEPNIEELLDAINILKDLAISDEEFAGELEAIRSRMCDKVVGAIKPCPFCGSAVAATRIGADFAMHCKVCGMRAAVPGSGAAELIKAWNQRA